MTLASFPSLPALIPASAGIGFRQRHEDELLPGTAPVGWLEVHSENYFHPGSRSFSVLSALRERYPVSLHGVGLSLGSADGLDADHLASLAMLAETIRPALVSEHLSWGAAGGKHTNDLLPMPYTEEALMLFAARVRQVQDRLQREILIENISSYLRFRESRISEPEFLVALTELSGCRLLIDVNNIYVNARNHGDDAAAYLDSIPGDLILEVHLAGHSVNRYGDREILIDTHGARVCDEVWVLYERLIRRIGPRPTLIEWDADVPPLATLVAEARRADTILESSRVRAA